MTTWYAINSSVDIDSVNEWNDVANGSGNWLTWASLAGDDILEANAKTAIEINVDSFTCASIKTLSGGGFTVTLTAGNNRVINADIIAGTTPCLVRSGTTRTLTVNGDVTGGSEAGAQGISGTDHNNMVINGNVTGGTASYGIGRGTSSSALTVTGNVVANAAAGLQAGYRATVTVTGNIIADGSVVGVAPYSSYYTIVLSGNLVCSSLGAFPLASAGTAGVRLKWSNVATGPTFSVRDASLDAHLVKLPDYPAEADVEAAVEYDYTNLTGTLAGGPPLIQTRRSTLIGR